MATDTLTSTEQATATVSAEAERGGLLSRRTRRRAGEAALAYLLLAPALLIIFTFGIFPLAFSLYESTLSGLNRIVGRYTGLDNYVRAMDKLAYVLAFWIAVALLFLAVRSIVRISREGRIRGEAFYLWLPAGALLGVAFALITRWVFIFLPHMLSIPDQLERGQELTRELFFQFFGEAWRVPEVQSAWRLALIALAIGLVAVFLTYRYAPRTPRNSQYFAGFLQAAVMIIGAAALSRLTYTEIQKALLAAQEAGETLDVWPLIVSISGGIFLLVASYYVWRSSNNAQSTTRMLVRMGAALLLAIGAWVLIAELPQAIAAGDDDWWQSLLSTVYFAGFTIPIQFAISLTLAAVLFQGLKGQTVFRVIYFLPYIAPLVGTAAAFRLIFSGRANAPINSILTGLGLEPLAWLNEPTGIFQLMVGDSIDLPTLLAGPSLALFTIVIYNVWTYIGFDIVIFLAGLGNIPSELYEAASIDGAGRWHQFRNVTLPLLSPTIYFLMLLAVIGTFKAFNRIYVMREAAALGTTDTTSVLIFETFNRDTRYGYASALAILLLIIVVVLTVANNRISEKRVFYG